MKKRTLSLLTVIALLFSLTTTTSATVGNTRSVTRASDYLDGYSVGIEARGDGEICVIMTVDGKGTMDKIGVTEVYIEKKLTASGRSTKHSMPQNTRSSICIIPRIMSEMLISMGRLV